jgi:hypothetical protein
MKIIITESQRDIILTKHATEFFKGQHVFSYDGMRKCKIESIEITNNNAKVFTTYSKGNNAWDRYHFEQELKDNFGVTYITILEVWNEDDWLEILANQAAKFK